MDDVESEKQAESAGKDPLAIATFIRWQSPLLSVGSRHFLLQNHEFDGIRPPRQRPCEWWCSPGSPQASSRKGTHPDVFVSSLGRLARYEVPSAVVLVLGDDKEAPIG